MRKQHDVTNKITYGQLTQILTALGFKRKKTDEFIVFREADHDALILLPARDDRSLVGDPYLVAISNTVAGKGVATAEQLYSLLTTSRDAQTASPKSGTNGYELKKERKKQKV